MGKSFVRGSFVHRSRVRRALVPGRAPGASASPNRGVRPRLPDLIWGTTRRSVWRRTRARRVAAALLAAAATWLVVTALAPHPPETGVPVVVAARDLPTGARVGDADVRVERRPGSQRAAGTVEALADAVGRVTAGPVAAGEVVTSARFRGPPALAGLTPSRLAVSVPLADAGLVGSLRPGDAVAVLAPGTGATVATSAPVLEVSTGPAGSDLLGGGGDTGARVVLALRDDEARAVAAALGGPSGPVGFVLALRAS